MQIFQLLALCATMALDASLSAAVVDHEHEDSPLPQASSVGDQAEASSSAGSSSPSASSTSSSTFSLGDLAGFEATLSPQRSRSVSPRCIGARGGGKRKEAAPPAAEDLKVHRRQRESAKAPASGSSSPASTTSYSSTEDRVGFKTSHHHHSRCFGARGGNRKEAATTSKGETAVSAPPAVEDLKAHRRQRKCRAPGAKAPASGSSSPASTTSSSPSAEDDRVGFKTSHHHHSRCFGSKLPRGRRAVTNSNSTTGGPRSPRKKHGEAKQGGGVGGYLREISRRLRRGGAGAPSSTTRTRIGAGTSSVRQPSRGGVGNAIASDGELRAFAIASARNTQRNGPPVVPLGLL